MTLEEFAHRCLMIKAGNTTLDIPCCANCESYESLTFSDGETIYECQHPATMALYMAPEDFCSRWRSRNEPKEEQNGKDNKNE